MSPGVSAGLPVRRSGVELSWPSPLDNDTFRMARRMWTVRTSFIPSRVRTARVTF